MNGFKRHFNCIGSYSVWEIPKTYTVSALVYLQYEMLCFSNSMAVVGWAVCSQVIQNPCKSSEGTKWYQRKVGNAPFHRRVQSHLKHERSDSDTLIVLQNNKNKDIFNVSCKVVGLTFYLSSFVIKNVAWPHLQSFSSILGKAILH